MVLYLGSIPVTSPGQDHTCIHPGSRSGNFSLAWTDRQIGSKCMATMGDAGPEAHSVDPRRKHGACTRYMLIVYAVFIHMTPQDLNCPH